MDENTGDEHPVVGVIGVGHLMQHVVPGLMSAVQPPTILLGGRNARRAQALSSRFGLEIVADPHKLVSRSQIVIVAVRPNDVVPAMRGLPWRANHTVLSFAATVPANSIQRVCPDVQVVQALPVVAAQYGQSATVMFPENTACRQLLEPCGPVFAMRDEGTFEASSALGAWYGWVQMLMGETADWLCAKGLERAQAEQLAAGMAKAAATSAGKRHAEGLAKLVEELCIPGSLTGDGVRLLTEKNAIDPWLQALDHTLDRIRSDQHR